VEIDAERIVDRAVNASEQRADIERLRAADVDTMGHVNNAALWQALCEVVTVPQRNVSVSHHASIDRDDVVTLVTAPGELWLTVDDEVRLSAQYELF